MIQLLDRAWRFVRVSWNLGSRRGRRGVRLARRVIRITIISVVVWPFVLLVASLTESVGFVAAIALAPLLVLLFLVVIYPLISTALAAVPQTRVLLGWLFVVIFAELVFGLYLVVVRVWNDPGLIPLFILLVVVLGMFLILKRQFGWQNRWATRFAAVLMLGIVVITVLFFLGGRQRVVQNVAGAGRSIQRSVSAAIPTVQAQQPFAPQEFVVNAGQEEVTIMNGPGTFHRTRAIDKQGNSVEWLALSRLPDGSYQEYRMKSVHSWRGGEPEGLLRVRGLVDGTTLRFERVR
jgi:hypothetical protein